MLSVCDEKAELVTKRVMSLYVLLITIPRAISLQVRDYHCCPAMRSAGILQFLKVCICHSLLGKTDISACISQLTPLRKKGKRKSVLQQPRQRPRAPRAAKLLPGEPHSASQPPAARAWACG